MLLNRQFTLIVLFETSINIVLQVTVYGSRCRGRLRKLWKNNAKEWTGQSMSSLLCIADDSMSMGSHHGGSRRPIGDQAVEQVVPGLLGLFLATAKCH